MDQTIIHHVDNPIKWPTAVQTISHLLQNRPSPCVSGTNSTGIAIHDGCGNYALAHTSQPLESRRVFEDIINTVLASVDRIRAVATLNKETNGLHPTSIFWLPLLTTLSLMCSEHASIVTEATFILARSDKTRFDSTGGLRDGHAHLLVSYVVDPEEARMVEDDQLVDGKGMKLNGRKPGNSGRPSFKISKGADSDDQESMEHSSASASPRSLSTTPSTASLASFECPIQVPFCAHIIPGRGVRTHAVLPVISVAEEDEVQALLSSVLYQRYVWGIKVPAIGIALSTTGIFARIIFGWTEPSSLQLGVLPTVHLAFATPLCPPNSALGIFDLTDPLSALRLSQFILALKTHFANVVSDTCLAQICPLPWRADHVFIDTLMPDETDHEDEFYRLPHWVRTSTASSNSCTHPQTPSSHDFVTLPMVPSAPSKLAIGENSLADTFSSHVLFTVASNTPEIASGMPVQASVQVTTGEAQSKGERSSCLQNYSPPKTCSSFAAQRVSGDLTRRATAFTWLMERSVIRITNHQFSNFNEHWGLKNRINKKLRFYNEVTAFPAVDLAMMTAYQAPPELTVWHDTLKNDYSTALAESKHVIELSPHLQSLLQGRLYDILHVSSNISQIIKAAKGLTPSKVESRFYWDRLLYNFAITNDQLVSQNIMLHRTLSLPRNETPEVIEAKRILECIRATAAVNLLLCRAVVGELWSIDGEIPGAEAENFLSEAREIKRALDNLTEDTLATALQEHCIDEPLNGKADAVLVARVKLQLLESETTSYEGRVAFVDNIGSIRDSSHSPGESHGPDADLKASTIHPSATTTTSTHTINHLAHEASGLVRLKVRGDMQETDSEPFIRFPILIAQHDADKLAGQALNQARMYCVSSAMSMRKLLIPDYVVFGVVTHGSIGWLIMCWNDPPIHKPADADDSDGGDYNTDDDDDDGDQDADTFCNAYDQIYLLERNTKLFDISVPIQCLHFATVLLRLAKYGQEVTERFVGSCIPDDPQARFFAVGKEHANNWRGAFSKET